MKSRLFLDTNVWYNKQECIELSKTFCLVSTAVNVLEISLSSKVKAKPKLVENALKNILEFHTEHIAFEPVYYFIKNFNLPQKQKFEDYGASASIDFVKNLLKNYDFKKLHLPSESKHALLKNGIISYHTFIKEIRGFPESNSFNKMNDEEKICLSLNDILRSAKDMYQVDLNFLDKIYSEIMNKSNTRFNSFLKLSGLYLSEIYSGKDTAAANDRADLFQIVYLENKDFYYTKENKIKRLIQEAKLNFLLDRI